MAMIAQEWSIQAMAVELGIARNTLARAIDRLEVKPVREEVVGNRTNRFYRMRDVCGIKGDGDRLDPAQERAMLDKQRREKLEIETAELEGRLHDRDECKAAAIGVWMVARETMMAAPARMGVDRETEAKMEDEIRDALETARKKLGATD